MRKLEVYDPRDPHDVVGTVYIASESECHLDEEFRGPIHYSSDIVEACRSAFIHYVDRTRKAPDIFKRLSKNFSLWLFNRYLVKYGLQVRVRNYFGNYFDIADL